MRHFICRGFLTLTFPQNAEHLIKTGCFLDIAAPAVGALVHQLHIGHQPGKEYWRCRDAAESLGWSQSQFNDYMNHDPKNFYQFESHESNISHRYEDKSKDISSEIEAMKKYEKENGSKESKNKCTKK